MRVPKKWTAELVVKWKTEMAQMPLIEVPLLVTREDEDGEEYETASWEAVSVGADKSRPDWTVVSQVEEDMIHKLDMELVPKLRPPEAEPYRLTDNEWYFMQLYSEVSGKGATPNKYRKRFERLVRKARAYMVYFAAFAARRPKG